MCFDNWYSNLNNLKAVRTHGWHFLTRLKRSRLVNPDGHGNVSVSTVAVPGTGRQVHLKGFGFILVFRMVTPDGDAAYWATNDLSLPAAECDRVARQCWAVESYHRGLKQCCGVERAHVRKAAAQWHHIMHAVRAFVHLEAHCLYTGVHWYTAKASIIRAAIRHYLSHPTISLDATA